MINFLLEILLREPSHETGILTYWSTFDCKHVNFSLIAWTCSCLMLETVRCYLTPAQDQQQPLSSHELFVCTFLSTGTRVPSTAMASGWEQQPINTARARGGTKLKTSSPKHMLPTTGTNSGYWRPCILGWCNSCCRCGPSLPHVQSGVPGALTCSKRSPRLSHSYGIRLCSGDKLIHLKRIWALNFYFKNITCLFFSPYQSVFISLFSSVERVRPFTNTF